MHMGWACCNSYSLRLRQEVKFCENHRQLNVIFVVKKTACWWGPSLNLQTSSNASFTCMHRHLHTWVAFGMIAGIHWTPHVILDNKSGYVLLFVQPLTQDQYLMPSVNSVEKWACWKMWNFPTPSNLIHIGRGIKASIHTH